MPHRRSWLRRFAFVIGLGFARVGVAAVLERLGAGGTGVGMALGSSVGVVELQGEIRDAEKIVDDLAGLRKDPSVVAIVVRIDSPGGAVAPSQEIYDEIGRCKESKPVIASLGNIAASGGYYIAAATTAIVAAPGTLTGSIGVIMEFRGLRQLADKVGITEEVVKSGPFKDIGNPLRPVTDTERKLLQSMVDDVYAQFVEAVAAGRGIDRAKGRQRADGRLYSGQQAKAAGLVDELGGYTRAIEIAWERAGQSGEPKVRKIRGAWHPWWFDMIGEAMTAVRPGVGGGLLFLYGGPTPQ
jgi:protease-4